MDWKTIAGKLARQGLPTLAAAVGGPAGAAAAAAARMAAQIGAAEATPEVLDQALDVADPDDIARLRELDIELERERRATWSATVSAEERALAVQEANIREARLADDLNPTRVRLVYTALAVLLLGAVGLAIGMRYLELPAEVFGLLAGILGMLSTKFAAGWDFFFGTSSGSAAKERQAAAERLMDRPPR